MGKSRAERRVAGARSTLFNLYGANTALGWHVIRQVPGCEAAEKTALRKWREVFYDDGSLAGYQVLASAAGAVKFPASGATSPATITYVEVCMNAGLFGRSRTMGMPEWKRQSRHARLDPDKILAPEDAIERAIEKVNLWPYPASRVDDGTGKAVFGDRAVRAYPKAR